jgi:hypothetical protein
VTEREQLLDCVRRLNASGVQYRAANVRSRREFELERFNDGCRADLPMAQALFVRGDVTLWAVGYNTYGSLGDGTTDPRSTPVFITNNVVAAAAGAQHSLFLKSDGTLWAMGDNNYGELGLGTSDNNAHSVPANVASNGRASIWGGFSRPKLTHWARGSRLIGLICPGRGGPIGRPYGSIHLTRRFSTVCVSPRSGQWRMLNGER